MPRVVPVVRRGLLGQTRRLAVVLREESLPVPLRRRLARHGRDLRFLLALCRAAAGFIWVRLLLGLFGMDLYEVYWWFAAGLAVSLLSLAEATGRRTAWLCEQCAEAGVPEAV